jgi:hypothetical protein
MQQQQPIAPAGQTGKGKGGKAAQAAQQRLQQQQLQQQPGQGQPMQKGPTDGRGTPASLNGGQSLEAGPSHSQGGQAHLQQQQQQQGRPSSSASSTSAGASDSGGNSNRFHIPDKLAMPSHTAEAFPSSRPTISSGLASNPIVGSPAITKPPPANLPSESGLGTSASTGAGGAPGANTDNAGQASANMASGSGMGLPGAAGGGSGIPGQGAAGVNGTGQAPSLGGQLGPLALKNAEGRPYNKRKLQELVASIDENQVLDAQVEDVRVSRL